MLYFLAKTIHVIGFVSWFAGLFYLGRMFVYHAEAFEKEEPAKSILSDQIGLMQRRVFAIIMNPAIVLTWVFGLIMIYINGMDWFKLNTWLHYKLLFLLMLTFYHFYCKKIISQLGEGEVPMDSFRFRLFNEVPTILLIIISVLAVYKNNTNPVIMTISIVGVLGTLFGLTVLYKRIRQKKETYQK